MFSLAINMLLLYILHNNAININLQGRTSAEKVKNFGMKGKNIKIDMRELTDFSLSIRIKKQVSIIRVT